jgi:hypothetical protein
MGPAAAESSFFKARDAGMNNAWTFMYKYPMGMRRGQVLGESTSRSTTVASTAMPHLSRSANTPVAE